MNQKKKNPQKRVKKIKEDKQHEPTKKNEKGEPT